MRSSLFCVMVFLVGVCICFVGFEWIYSSYELSFFGMNRFRCCVVFVFVLLCVCAFMVMFYCFVVGVLCAIQPKEDNATDSVLYHQSAPGLHTCLG